MVNCLQFKPPEELSDQTIHNNWTNSMNFSMLSRSEDDQLQEHPQGNPHADKNYCALVAFFMVFSCQLVYSIVIHLFSQPSTVWSWFMFIVEVFEPLIGSKISSVKDLCWKIPRFVLACCLLLPLYIWSHFKQFGALLISLIIRKKSSNMVLALKLARFALWPTWWLFLPFTTLIRFLGLLVSVISKRSPQKIE